MTLYGACLGCEQKRSLIEHLRKEKTALEEKLRKISPPEKDGLEELRKLHQYEDMLR